MTTQATTSTSQSVAEVGVFEIQFGDCLGFPVADEQESVATVSCDEPHESEVYALFSLADGEYPGDAEVDGLAEAGCLDLFEATFQESYDTSPYFLSLLYPSETTWNDAADREIICLASGDDPLAQSIVPSAAIENAELVEAIAQAIVAPDSALLPIADARCAARLIVPSMGLARLGELGLSVDNVASVDDIAFNDEELELVVGSLVVCSDLSKLLADTLTRDGTLTPSEGVCFAAEFDEQALQSAFRKLFAGFGFGADPGEEFLAEFLDTFSECGVSF